MQKQMKKKQYMAYISYANLGRSKFYNILPSKNRVQDINFNQIKLKLNEI